MDGTDPIVTENIPAGATDPTPAAPPVLSPLQRELLRKMELEAAMVAAPHDQTGCAPPISTC